MGGLVHQMGMYEESMFQRDGCVALLLGVGGDYSGEGTGCMK